MCLDDNNCTIGMNVISIEYFKTFVLQCFLLFNPILKWFEMT
jgi:hypothetical protein